MIADAKLPMRHIQVCKQKKQSRRGFFFNFTFVEPPVSDSAIMRAVPILNAKNEKADLPVVV